MSQIYDDYNTFCLANMNKAEDESLLTDHVGTTQLQFVPAGFWLHPSRTSACIAFKTNLPAKGSIECDTGSVPPEDEREFTLHIYHVTNLAQDTTHDYTLIAKRGVQTITQQGQFTTATPPGATLVTPPDGNTITLNVQDSYYVLTADHDFDNRGFTIHARGITLDLDGHTITYNNGPTGGGTYGIYCEYNLNEVKIVNGQIKQGTMNSGSSTTGIGYNAIMSRSGPLDVRGIQAEISGENVVAIHVSHTGTTHKAYHNVVIDHGTEIENRGQGVRAMDLNGDVKERDGAEAHYNLVKRCRHRGIDCRSAFGNMTNNEVWQDSWATNAFGITCDFGTENFVYLHGYWAGAFSWRASPQRLDHNYVNGYGIPSDRDTEYSTLGTCQGFRMTYYGGATTPRSGNTIENNTVVLRGVEGAILRGIGWSQDVNAQDNVIRNNLFKIVSEDYVESPHNEAQACITIHGNDSAAHKPHAPTNYSNNTCIANTMMVCTGEPYGSGDNCKFYNNRFERIGNNPGFATVVNWYGARPSIDHDFHNTVTVGCEMDDTRYGTYNEGNERYYNVYPDGYQMRSTAEGMVKIQLEVGHNVLTEADEHLLLENGEDLLLESASPPVIVPARPYVYRPKYVFCQRPHRFALEPANSLHDGLIFAQLGNVVSPNTAHDSANPGKSAYVDGAGVTYHRLYRRPSVRYDDFNTYHRYPINPANNADQYTWFWLVQPEGVNHHAWIVCGDGTGRRFFVGGNTAGRVFVILRGSGGIFSRETTASDLLVPGQWQYWVATYPGGDVANIRFYLNGSEVASRDAGDPGVLNTANRGMQIGRYYNDSGPCLLSDVMVWTRVLSEPERARLSSKDPLWGGFVVPQPRRVYSIPRGDVAPTPPDVRTTIFDAITIG